MHFEIKRLNEVEESDTDRTIVDAATVAKLVKQAAAAGERLYIRPIPAPAS